jgi:transcriptional regulator with XRE-family HTH domain
MTGRLELLRLQAQFWLRPDVVTALENRNFGELFRLIRRYAGASQTQIAIAVIMSQGQISEIMAGHRRLLALDVLERVLTGLGAPDSARLAVGLAPQVRGTVLPSDAAATPERVGEPARRDSAQVRESTAFVGPEDVRVNDVLLGDVLRRALHGRRIVDGARQLSLVAVESAVKAANAAYQAADYARLSTLPETVAAAERLTRDTSGAECERAYRALAWANVVASKLAAKLGDGVLASVTADRAAACGVHLGDTALVGVAAYQTASALIKVPDRLSDADNVAMTAAEDLAPQDPTTTASRRSVRGALLLHGAVTAARLGDRQQAQRRLDAAGILAEAVGCDANEYRTAFGPTNVLLHRLAAAVALGDFDNALELGDRIDTSGMPPALLSRRAQLHLDLAAVHTSDPAGDPEAVLHLLQAERIAPQVITTNAEARTLVLTLLGRERRSRTPGLRALAQRSQLAA